MIEILIRKEFDWRELAGEIGLGIGRKGTHLVHENMAEPTPIDLDRWIDLDI